MTINTSAKNFIYALKKDRKWIYKGLFRPKTIQSNSGKKWVNKRSNTKIASFKYSKH